MRVWWQRCGKIEKRVQKRPKHAPTAHISYYEALKQFLRVEVISLILEMHASAMGERKSARVVNETGQKGPEKAEKAENATMTADRVRKDERCETNRTRKARKSKRG